MHRRDQGRQAQLEATVSAAMETAWADASRRAAEIIQAARLATAVHMSQAAESARGHDGWLDTEDVSRRQAASAPKAGAASLVRGGGVL